jgi:CheY-like chemotaxis protein
MRVNDQLRDLRILVVDDENDTRETPLSYCSRQEGHALAVGSAAEALESYRSTAATS